MGRPIFKSPFFWLLLVALLIFAGFALWRFKHDTTVIPSTHPTTHTTNQTIRQGTASKQGATNDSPGPATIPQGKANSTGTDNAAPLTAPTGTFVSNHRPGQNGSPDTENSTCVTTPGATCYIEFTMGSTTHKLDTETAGGDGTVVWNWNVGDAGLASGNWQITAVASLDGQTKSTSDQLSLEIQ